MRKVCLLFILLVAGTSAFTVGHRDPVEDFWRWFRDHETQLLAVRTGGEPIADELARVLHRVDSTLTWEFGPAVSGPREFVVSAGGIRAGFPSVERVVAAAPALSRWRVVKFRPRRPDVTLVRVDGVELDARNVVFVAEPDGARVALTIAVPNYRVTPTKAYEQAVYLLLDGMLGEYTVETRVGGIAIIAASDRRAAQWLPLTDVAKAVDAVAVR